MHIQLLSVNLSRASVFKNGESDYLNRLKHYTKIELIQIRGEKILRTRTETEILQAEGERVLSKIAQGSYVVVLDRNGDYLSSEEMAQKILNWQNRSLQNVFFIIGGPLGLCGTVIHRADFVLSLSKMTFPHEMVRLMLLEQLYRAFTILKGEKYHK